MCPIHTPISLTKLLSLGAALDIPIRSKGPRGKIHTVLSLRIRQRWRLFSSYRTSFSGTLLRLRHPHPCLRPPPGRRRLSRRVKADIRREEDHRHGLLPLLLLAVPPDGPPLLRLPRHVCAGPVPHLRVRRPLPVAAAQVARHANVLRVSQGGVQLRVRDACCCCCCFCCSCFCCFFCLCNWSCFIVAAACELLLLLVQLQLLLLLPLLLLLLL